MSILQTPEPKLKILAELKRRADEEKERNDKEVLHNLYEVKRLADANAFLTPPAGFWRDKCPQCKIKLLLTKFNQFQYHGGKLYQCSLCDYEYANYWTRGGKAY